ncbi:MAG: diaminopimelate epimerase [Nakamurella sp.]
MTSQTATAQQLEFVKGHGTENDFVLLPDPDDRLDLTPELVRALCDRHAGLGADGVIRVVRVGVTGFFMDYYNADGSIAEMCGNGARVFARYLVEAGWTTPGHIDFETRGGPRWAELGTIGHVAIGMGPVKWGVTSSAAIGTYDDVPGLTVDVGNPHLACLVATDISDFDLTAPPRVDSALFPNGANVEVIEVVDTDHVRMRVHERGVGETRSCGTGTVAAAAAYLVSEGRDKGRVTVDVLGGSVRVGIAHHPHGAQATLIGPAALVASGTIDTASLPGLK